jgi:hypothetical protein
MTSREQNKIIDLALHAYLGHWAIAVHQATHPDQRAYAEQRHDEILSVLHKRGRCRGEHNRTTASLG